MNDTCKNVRKEERLVVNDKNGTSLDYISLVSCCRVGGVACVRVCGKQDVFPLFKIYAAHEIHSAHNLYCQFHKALLS